jgi:thiol-disulfide isomerase/thioredoxin
MNLRHSIALLICLIGISLFFLNSQATIINITSEKQFNDLFESKKPLVLKFFTDACHVCDVIKLPFEAVSNENEFKPITFAALNFSESGSIGDKIARQYKVLGAPTFIYILDKNEVGRMSGIESARTFKTDLRSQLRNYFGTKLEKTTEETKPEEIISIEMEEELAPVPLEEKEEAKPEEAKGTLAQLWFSIQTFFSFIFEKIKEALLFIINQIKRIFGQ